MSDSDLSPSQLSPGASSPQRARHGDIEDEAEKLYPSVSAKGISASRALPNIDTRLLSASRPGMGSRRSSYIAQIDEMLPDDHIDEDTYGVRESRDGFFDAIFLKQMPLDTDDAEEHGRQTLPAAFDKDSPLAASRFIPRQIHELKSLCWRVTTTRTGIRLAKSFTAYFAAYILCLVPMVRAWLGRYHYIMAVSVILNHPARTFGAQIEGSIFTIVGTAAGLGWGVIGLLLSTSTLSASAGYGGILILFLAIFMGTTAFLRSYYTRFYQVVLCAGIAIVFTTLAQTGSRSIEWAKIRSYAIPWLLGQAIALAVNCLIFPDAGARPLAITLHQSIDNMLEALIIPRPRDTRLRRRLALSFVNLSQSYRDMKINITIMRFKPDDVRELRNLMQGVIRGLLSMETETQLFSEDAEDAVAVVVDDTQASSSSSTDNLGSRASENHNTIHEKSVARRVIKKLGKPTREILVCMEQGLRSTQAALMDMSGYRRHLGPPMSVSSDLAPIQIRIKHAKAAFDVVESELLESGRLPAASMDNSAIVQLFVFARHIREAATAVENLVGKVHLMKKTSNWPIPRLPSYPLSKAVHCTNAQVRHDRGGATAGSYHVTFLGIAHALESIKSKEYKPLSETEPVEDDASETDLQAQLTHLTDGTITADVTTKRNSISYKIWRFLRNLQGYDARYAFKTILITSLLSVPSYLVQNKDWWDMYEVWWAVAMSWVLIHSRVGGNVQDLFTRAFAAILGAVWSGAAYAAGNGSPYVVAVFAAIYMLPMLYRFTLSTHPRSGLVGCLSFTVISLRLQADGSQTSPAVVAVLKGIVFLVGTVSPIVVNWVLWPFVARHELRKSLSSMMFFLSIIYRNVVAKYIYFEEGHAPTPEDIEKSEVLEGRIREGFVRIRQLLIMTRHEIRLRAPFDPLPYSALADSCERFFEYLIALRQSAIFYNPGYIRDHPTAGQKLLSYRRDAVASILANLYILAGALRVDRKVPRYLSSAAAARRKLLVETVKVEEEFAAPGNETEMRWHKKWSDIYSYSYNESLTGCVAQLEELEKYTKLIVGEHGFYDDLILQEKGEYEDEDDDTNEN